MIYYSGVFISGFILLLFEILGIRILTPDFGGHILTVSGVIGVFLLSLSIGYELGGRLADSYPSHNVFSILFSVSGCILFVFTGIARPISNWIAEYEIGKIFAPYLAAFFIFTVPAMILATISPFAVRLCTHSLERVGSTAGRIFAVSTMGSILGALSAPFLIYFFQVRPILYTASGVLVLFSVILFLSQRRKNVAKY